MFSREGGRNTNYDSFGGTIVRFFKRMPTTLRVIILLNTGVYVLQLIFGLIFKVDLIPYLSFFPSPEVAFTQPWRIITYMFTHALNNPFHFLFNMLWLYWMGKPVEERIGPRNFLVIYVVAGLMGAFIDFSVGLFYQMPPVVGASGAVYGAMVAFAMLFPREKIMLLLLPPIETRFVVAGLIALDVIFLTSNDGIARLVHLGGALGGYLMMRLYLGGRDFSNIVRYFEYAFSKFMPSKKSSSSHRKNPNMNIVSDAKVVEEVDESELDAILDKISKSGYDALSKEEKRKLFELSKKNQN